MDLNWQPSALRRFSIDHAEKIRLFLRSQRAIESHALVLSAIVAIVALASSQAWLARAAWWLHLIVTGMTLGAFAIVALLWIVKRRADPAPEHGSMPTVDPDDAHARIVTLEQECVFRDLTRSATAAERSEFIEDVTELSYEAFCFFSSKTKDERREYVSHVARTTPAAYTILVSPHDVGPKPRVQFGYTATIPLDFAEAQRFRNGEASQFALRLLAPTDRERLFAVYFQAIYLRPGARHELAATGRYPDFALLAIMRAVGRIVIDYGRQPEVVLAAGVSRRGQSLLDSLGFEKPSRSSAGEPIYWLPLRQLYANHDVLFNSRGRETSAVLGTYLERRLRPSLFTVNG